MTQTHPVRYLGSLAVIAVLVAGCSGASEPDDARASASSTPSATPSSAATPASASPDYDNFVREVRGLGDLTSGETRGTIVEIGDSICKELDGGRTIADIATLANYEKRYRPYVPAITTLAVLRVCPAYASEVDVLDVAPVEVAASTPAPTAEPSAEPEPALPVTFGDGLYEAGRDIAPGRYRNDGPTAAGGPCVAVTSSTPDSMASFIAASNGAGPGILDVSDGDFVTVTNCQQWNRD